MDLRPEGLGLSVVGRTREREEAGAGAEMEREYPDLIGWRCSWSLESQSGSLVRVPVADQASPNGHGLDLCPTFCP